MKIILYGQWRTGTNPLIDIFTDMGFYNFEEYYSRTGIAHPDLVHPRKDAREESNLYLHSLLKQRQVDNCIIKINFQHTTMPTYSVENMFDVKMVLYRKDFLQTAISQLVAEDRRSWINYGFQIPYKKSIDLTEIEKRLIGILTDIDIFVKSIDIAKINQVVNYEEDLVPYIKIVGSRHRVSANYQIENIQEIREWYNNSELFEKFGKLITYFDTLKSKINTVEFSEFVETIKKALNENK